jgi:ribose-phosphate pyrophosphokinase
VEDIKVIGNIENKEVVIVDDMIDTAGTICLAADMMVQEGAKSVRVCATHPVLSGSAFEKIENSSIEEIIVTDTIPVPRESNRIKIISVAELFADVINKVYNYESISSKFIQ